MDKFILYFRVTKLEISGFFLFGKIEWSWKMLMAEFTHVSPERDSSCP